MADYIYTMETRLTPNQMKGVSLVQDLARAQGMNVYLTGGAIRDIVSGFPIRDLDFSVQGNALKLRKDLERAGVVIQGTDEDLRVLFALLPGNVRAEISMARQETYDKPGKGPQISQATINEDLRRRDFTINAMALSLNPGSRGLLLDPFNGVADIESKVIRILHNYAFLEEPSRLIRATRFSSRFHWQLEERTQLRYEAAKENNYIEYIAKSSVGYEIEQIAHEDDPLHILKTLEKEGWLKFLHPHWSSAKAETSELNQLLKTRTQMIDIGFSVDAAPAVMHFLTRRMGEKDIAEMQKLIPRRDFVDAWKHLDDGAKDLAKKVMGKEAATPSRAYQLLTNANPEALLFLDVTVRQQAVEQKLKNFFGKWRQVKDKLPLPEMAELLITPQLPIYPKLADDVHMMMLDGKLKSHTEIMKFLKPFAPPPPPPPPPPPVKRGRGAAKAAEAAAGAVAGATPGKKGRKPKNAAVAAPVPVPVNPPPAAVPAHSAKPAVAGEKPSQKVHDAAVKKIAAKAVPAKQAAPVAVAKPVAKKVAPVKVPAKKAPNKPVSAKKAAPKAAKPVKKAVKKPAKPVKKAAKKK